MTNPGASPNFLPPEAYGISPYKYTGTGQEQPDIPLGLGLKYNQENPAVPSLADSGSFTPSKLSQDALKFLKEKTGKEINIKPLDIFQKMSMGNQSEGLMGMYQGRHPGETPNQRTVFINPDNPAGLGTLFHEAGHAVDPELKQQHELQKKFNSAYINQLSKPSERLNYLFETTGFPKVISETEGQRFAGESLNEFQKQQQAANKSTFDPQTFTNNPNYKFYPGSYAGQTVSRFFSAELPNRRPLQQQLTPGSDTYGYDATGSTVFQPPTAEKGVALGTDPRVWQTQEQIMQKTRDYIDPRLNQYMANPTPAFENFWSPK